MKAPTKDRVLLDALALHGGDVLTAFDHVKDDIGVKKPLIYTCNPSKKGAPKGTPRQPLPMSEQYDRVMKRLNQLAKKGSFAGSDSAPADTGTGTEGGTGSPDVSALEEQVKDAKARLEEARNGLEAAKADHETAKKNVESLRDTEGEALDKYIEARNEGSEDEFPLKEDYEKAMSHRKDGEADEQEKADTVEGMTEIIENMLEEIEGIEERIREMTPGIEDEIIRYIREVERLREFARDRDINPFDSYRVEIEGVKGITDGGLPVDGLLDSLTADWGEDTREQADITAFDYKVHGDAPKGSHAASDYVLGLIKANIPVWLHGPAGTGKSTCARYSAEALGLDYYEVNLAGALPSAVKGKDRLNEFIEAEFCKAYENGGVLVLEEFDMAHPQTAGAINNAIANGHFHNDANGKVIERHPEFRIVATANTLGIGATHEHNARVKLDGATLDRFRLGRVFIDRDDTLCKNIVNTMLSDRDIDLRV